MGRPFRERRTRSQGFLAQGRTVEERCLGILVGPGEAMRAAHSLALPSASLTSFARERTPSPLVLWLPTPDLLGHTFLSRCTARC